MPEYRRRAVSGIFLVRLKKKQRKLRIFIVKKISIWYDYAVLYLVRE